MPVVHLSFYQKPEIFCRWLVSEMFMRNITQAQIGEWLCVSQQAVGKKLKNHNFGFLEMLIIFNELKTDSETQIKLMTL